MEVAFVLLSNSVKKGFPLVTQICTLFKIKFYRRFHNDLGYDTWPTFFYIHNIDKSASFLNVNRCLLLRNFTQIIVVHSIVHKSSKGPNLLRLFLNDCFEYITHLKLPQSTQKCRFQYQYEDKKSFNLKHCNFVCVMKSIKSEFYSHIIKGSECVNHKKFKGGSELKHTKKNLKRIPQNDKWKSLPDDFDEWRYETTFFLACKSS